MKPQFIALLPCVAFIVTFTFLACCYGLDSVHDNNFAMCASFIALIVAIFTFQKKETFNERLEIFIKGSSQSIVIYLCYIFFLSAIFTTILEETHSIQAMTSILLHIIPMQCILPAILICSSFFGFAAATSMGPIAICMPIALAISKYIGCNVALIAATVVCGTIFGENLFILTDAIKTKRHIHNFDIANLHFNIKIILIAFIGAIIILFYHNSFINHFDTLANLPTINFITFIKILPYCLAFYLASTKLDFIIILVLGIMLSLSIGIYFNNITALRAINILFDGFYHSKDAVNACMLIFLLSGLSTIIQYNGGIEYLIHAFKAKLAHVAHSQCASFCLISLINICITIIITGQITKKISRNYAITPKETFYVPDIQPSVLQGMLPYIPQLALASLTAHVSILALIPYLYYQILLATTLLLGTIVYNHNLALHAQKTL